MNQHIKTAIALLLTVIALAGCAADPEPRDPYNSPDSQRDRASDAQDELSSETSR